MRLSELFSKTSKQVPADEVSVNAKLLVQAGFVSKVAAGIYSYLPLGQKVIANIANIVREEMDAVGGQEIAMPVLHPKANWEQTGRWKTMDILYKTKGESGEFALGPTHEEIVVPLAKKFIASYADLPLAVYQIQTKFRDEPRAKSGLLRGREFLMKDLYSFHVSDEDFEKYYGVVKGAYKNIFARLGLDAVETRASGGSFSKYSDEYQVVCEAGEDEIIYCSGGDFAENTEIAKVKEGKQCDLGHGPLKKVKTIEVGNIFPLKDNFSKQFGLTFKDKDGTDKPVLMGCYGIGISRLMGAIVEVYHDNSGIVWPRSVSPFDVHLVHIEDTGTESWAKETYQKLTEAGISVLWDDRENVSAGEKFADCDLIGIPFRLVVSKKTGKGKVEVKERDKEVTKAASLDEVLRKFR